MLDDTKNEKLSVTSLRITPIQQAAASCSGAIITSLLVTPLDVVKTRLQAQQKGGQKSKCYLYCNGLMEHICECNPKYANLNGHQQHVHFNGTLDAFIKISRYEGISALWSGLSPTLVLALPATILYFVSYEQFKLKLNEQYSSKIVSNTGERMTQPAWIPLVSGASARIFAATCVSPLELVRTKMQSEKISYLEVTRALKMLVASSGFSGLWKGVTSTLLRDVPFSAIYWTSYESIKKLGKTETPPFSLSFLAGAISGSIAATATAPFDVIKTHQQIEFGEKIYRKEPSQNIDNMRSIAKRIVEQHGISGLYAGLIPRLMKVAPACAIMISTFEYGKHFFSQLTVDQRLPLTLEGYDSVSPSITYEEQVTQ